MTARGRKGKLQGKPYLLLVQLRVDLSVLSMDAKAQLLYKKPEKKNRDEFKVHRKRMMFSTHQKDKGIFYIKYLQLLQ